MNSYSGAIIAIFTGTLWISTRRQAQLTRESIDLAETSLRLLEQPILVVETLNSSSFRQYKKMNFTVKNHGRTAGHFIEYSATLKFGNHIGDTPFYGESVLMDKVIASGNSTYGIVVKVPPDITEDVLLAFENKQIRCFMIGYIRYKGTFTKCVRKGFGLEFVANGMDVKWAAGGTLYNYETEED